MKVKGYQIVVLPRAEEQGSGYFVTVPQLPGCMTGGTTREEATRNAWRHGLRSAKYQAMRAVLRMMRGN